MINIKENEKLSIMNHSCAHLLAQAVKHLYPNALFWVGPVIEEGFYYDIDLGDKTLTEEDLPAIEKEMKKLAKDGKRIVRHELSKEEALEKFKDDPYKIDLISRMDENDTVISCYEQGDFIDLCRGPHVESTKLIKYFKLLKVSGAYWKGDSKNKMLQRIYGTSFEKNKDLEAYLHLMEEAKKRDHRKLGKELELFFIPEEGPGFPLFMPKGMQLKNALLEFWREVHREDNYVEIETPIILNRHLWETSGHWYHYKENMFPAMDVEGESFVLRPMNCPHHMLIYANELHSYRDLPIRIGEIARDCRFESSGTLKGIERVRTFCQNPSGFVSAEVYDNNLTLVNGHSYKERKSTNTNLAILVSHHFTSPFKRPIEYGRNVAQNLNDLGAGNIVVQRLGDIYRGKRTWDYELERNTVVPTLKSAVAGDITFALGYRTMVSILEFIRAMGKIVGGFGAPDNLLYAPEIKFYSNKVVIDKQFETNIKGLYSIGDGGGMTRGLMMASCSGIQMARNL